MFLPRRPLILVVLALLVAPVAVMPFLPVRIASTQENRMLAKPLAWPQGLDGWRRLPRSERG